MASVLVLGASGYLGTHLEEMPARWTEGAFAYRQERHDVSYYGKSARSEGVTGAAPEHV